MKMQKRLRSGAFRLLGQTKKTRSRCWIGPYKKHQSLEQNALYWKLIGMVAGATGHSRDVLHIFFKRRAFGVQVERVGSDVVEYVPSSAKASRKAISQSLSSMFRRSLPSTE
jgi:hypothetical protein